MVENMNIHEVNQKTAPLSELDFIMGDKLAYLITVKLGWSPVRVGITAYVFAVSLSILIALVTGTLATQDEVVGLFNDRLYWVSETLLIPTIWGYYAWVITAPYVVIKSLQASGVIVMDKRGKSTIKSYFSRRSINYISLILGIIVGILYYVQHQRADPLWFSKSQIALAIRVLLVIIPTGYVTWVYILRLILNARLFRKMLHDVNLHPLHPDRAGGLGPLGKYALTTTYLIALGGSVVALAEYTWFINGQFDDAYFFHVAFILYLILAPLSFFAPLVGAHNAMLVAKEKQIHKISKQFNQDFSRAYDQLERSADALKDNIEKIEQLQKLHKLTSEFPIWPYDFDTLRRFTLTMLTPIFTIIITMVLERILRYFMNL